MADYTLRWCFQCQCMTWQTYTDYEGDVCGSGQHHNAELSAQRGSGP